MPTQGNYLLHEMFTVKYCYHSDQMTNRKCRYDLENKQIGMDVFAGYHNASRKA